MRHTVQRSLAIAVSAGALTSAAQAQTPITVVNGFLLQSWNAGTTADGRNDWHPDKPNSGWNNGIRWVWLENDGMAIVPPAIERVYDSSVPGITGAFRFPAARATSGVAASWEGLAQPGTPGTFELWFKPDDLVGQHVLWEVGAANKGVAIWLDDDEVVYSVLANDGAGGNIISYEHREMLPDTGWHQAALTIDFFGFNVSSYLNGVQVDAMGGFTPSATYRWSGGNTGGLGTVGSDPLFPFAGIANDPDPIDIDMDGIDDAPAVPRTDYEGLISTMRFYDIDLFPNEILDNYNALTDAAAAARRADLNGDGSADVNDALDFLALMSETDTTPIAPFTFPFPSAAGGGVQMNDPALDETYVGDFTWDRDDGFNPTSQEPTFQLPTGTLDVVVVNDLSVPSIRKAFELDGTEGFRGPKFEQADDATSVHVEFWLHIDDLTGNHCLFEAGGAAVGFSIVTRGDEIGAAIDTTANDGLDRVDIASGPGVLQTGWRKFDLVVRRFINVDANIGEGFEVYMDGVLVASLNDEPGLDGVIGTADDIDNFSPAGTGNTNFIGGNQAGYGQVQGTAPLPFGFINDDLSAFNGLVGPFRLAQSAPAPAQIAANFAADMGQNVVNGRLDVNNDGQADFFDVLDTLEILDAAP